MTKIPLNPPFSKGEISLPFSKRGKSGYLLKEGKSAFPPLEKGGRGDLKGYFREQGKETLG